MNESSERAGQDTLISSLLHTSRRLCSLCTASNFILHIFSLSPPALHELYKQGLQTCVKPRITQDPAFVLPPVLLDKMQDAHDKIAAEAHDDLAVFIQAMSTNSVKGPAGQAAKPEVKVLSSWTIGAGDAVEENEECVGVHGAIFCEGVADAVEMSATDPAHNSSFKGLMKECKKLHGNEMLGCGQQVPLGVS